MTDRDPNSEDLLRRIGEPLRAKEPLDPMVAARVMDVVRAETPTRYPRTDTTVTRDDREPAWWRRQSVRLSPAAAFAWAAGLVAIATLGTLRAVASSHVTGPLQAAGTPAAARAETVHVVRFVFRDPNARRVALVGDFNGWAKDATPLLAGVAKGAWAVSVTVPTGRHEYAFIVDGIAWSPDPFAPRVADEFGTESSVVTIGEVATSAPDASRKS